MRPSSLLTSDQAPTVLFVSMNYFDLKWTEVLYTHTFEWLTPTSSLSGGGSQEVRSSHATLQRRQCGVNSTRYHFKSLVT